MTEQGSTINEGQGTPTTTQSGATPAPTPEASSAFRKSSDNDLVSTVGRVPPTPKPTKTDTEPEVANKTEDQKEAAKKPEGDIAKPEEKPVEEERYDKIPRFKELITESKKARQEIAELKALLAKKEAPEEREELPYKDVSGMTKEQLLEWQDNDPHGYYANQLLQAKYELSKEFDSKITSRSMEEAIASTYSDFAKKNPDFDDLWDSGELGSYMKAHVGHNAISAYYAITSEKKAKEDAEKWEAEKTKIAKEAEKKALEAYRIKREAQVLSAGPAFTGIPEGVSPELLDSKKFGGATAVLAARSKARLAAKGQA